MASSQEEKGLGFCKEPSVGVLWIPPGMAREIRFNFFVRVQSKIFGGV